MILPRAMTFTCISKPMWGAVDQIQLTINDSIQDNACPIAASSSIALIVYKFHWCNYCFPNDQWLPYLCDLNLSNRRSTEWRLYRTVRALLQRWFIWSYWPWLSIMGYQKAVKDPNIPKLHFNHMMWWMKYVLRFTSRRTWLTFVMAIWCQPHRGRLTSIE